MYCKIFGVIAAACLVGISLPANAGRFNVTEYECSQMNVQRDGIKCAVRYLDGMGDTLMIRIHGKPDEPKEKLARRKYMISVTIQNFLASGGTWIMMRTNRKDGQLMERVCSRRKGGTRESCHEWYPVKDE